jgi:hypothetical protein
MSSGTGRAKPKKKRKGSGKLSKEAQSARFIAGAKALCLGDSMDDFNRAMDKLAPQKPRSS